MKNNCKRYGQAITDSVLGEEIDVPKEELMSHLKECAKCREEVTNWQDFQNALRVKEYHARPEVKEKWDRFINELTSGATATESEASRREGSPVRGAESPDVSSGGQPRPAQTPLAPAEAIAIAPLPGGTVLDEQAEIDKAAGTVWRYLAKNGWVKVKDLSKILKRETKLHPDAIRFGVGWLIHEKKVHLAEKKRARFVYLTHKEREIYQSQAQG